MRKIICLMLAVMVAVTVGPVIPVSAAASTAYDFTNIPSAWSISLLNELAQIKAEPFADPVLGQTNTLALLCRSTDSQRTSAEATTESFDMGEKVSIHLKMAVNDAASGARKRFRTVVNGNKVDLFTIEGLTLSLFGTTAAIPENTLFDLDLAMNLSENTAVAWKDGVQIFSGSIPAVGSTSFALNLWNGFSAKVADSRWYFSQFEVVTQGAFQVQSTPAPGAQLVKAEELDCVLVDFGVMPALSVIQAGGIQLKSGPIGGTDETTEPVVCKRIKNTLEIAPEEGFLPDREYRLSVTGFQDVFGVSHEVSPITFQTAPDHFTLPSATIVSPADHTAFPVGTPINIEADILAGSGAVTKTELVVNDEVVISREGKQTRLTYLPQEASSALHLFIRLYDSYGNVSESAAVEVSVFENQPPVLHLSAGDGASFAPGDIFRVEAVDEDGGLSGVQVFFDQTLLAPLEEGSAEYRIPSDTPFGRKVIKAVATDIYQASATQEISVLVVQAEEKLAYSANIAAYTGGTVDGLVISPNYTDAQHHYIRNADIEGRGNSVILGSENKTGSGGTCWIGWLTSPISGENVVVLDADLYLETNQTDSHLILRSNSNPAVFVEDVLFNRGVLQYYDGTTMHTKQLQLKTWYDIQFEFNLKDSTYNLTINGEKLASRFRFRKELGSLSYIRMDMNNTVNSPAFVAISKFNVKTKKEYPYLSALSLYRGETLLTGADELTADCLKYQISSTIDASKVTVTDITLTGDGKPMQLKSWNVASGLSAISVYPEDRLEAGYDYTLTMHYSLDRVSYASSYQYTAVPGSGFNLTEGKFVVENGMVRFDAQLQNPDGAPRPLLLIITGYRNGILEQYQYTQSTITQEAAQSTPALPYEEGMQYMAVAADGWQRLSPINNKIYRMN